MEAAVATPFRNLENNEVSILERKILEPEVCLDEEIAVNENLAGKTHIRTSSFVNKTPKVKQTSLKAITGEKRKFPYISDSVKVAKRVKPEDKVTKNTRSPKEKTINKSIKNETTPSAHEITNNTPCITQSTEDCIIIANNLDIENKSQVKEKSKQMSARQSKAIANKCRETLDKLLTFGLETLTAMEKTLNILNSHNLLNNKYISVDTLIQLILLALEASKSDAEKESVLLNIIEKRTEELCVTPKAAKAKQNIMAASVSLNNQSLIEENVPPSIIMENEEDMKSQPPKNQKSEDNTEVNEISIIEGAQEKSQEPAIEKSGNNFCITNYFKKLRKNVEERDKNERFSLFSTKTDMFLAPKLGGEFTEEKRKIFEEEFNSQTCKSEYLLRCSSKRKGKKCKRNISDNPVSNTVPSETRIPEKVEESSETHSFLEIFESESSGSKMRVSLIKLDVPRSEPVEMVCRGKAKLLQFYDNRRPPYWGTWRKKSLSVGGRRPFGKDKMFNYEVDSDDEWEEEEEPGESLRGSDDEKEPEEDYEVDNDFFVPHGYLSDDENPEKENLSPKTKLNLLEEQFTLELKEKTRKMTPFAFGSFWLYKGTESVGTLYQDLQIESLQYCPWTLSRVEIPEGDEIKCESNPEQVEPTSQSKKLIQKTFPDEEIPHLIKMIHESPKNCGYLARKFLLYWESEKIQDENRPRLTKVCVQKKIKELAAWQSSSESGKMCWYVPKTTREEFKTDVEKKSPEKKSQKCFIWKFVRKAEKFPGGRTSSISVPTPTPTPAPDSEVVVLE